MHKLEHLDRRDIQGRTDRQDLARKQWQQTDRGLHDRQFPQLRPD